MIITKYTVQDQSRFLQDADTVGSVVEGLFGGGDFDVVKEIGSLDHDQIRELVEQCKTKAEELQESGDVTADQFTELSDALDIASIQLEDSATARLLKRTGEAAPKRKLFLQFILLPFMIIRAVRGEGRSR